MTRALLCGYGRAGRRLGRGLDALGVDITICDPAISPYMFEQAISEYDFFDFALIATPPHLHLSQIRQCLDAGLPVLCEKPLCAWGQLAEAEQLLSHPAAGKVGMIFNYRWHPTIQHLILTRPQWQHRPDPFTALSVQYRERLPEWGLILDHLPHTVDLFLHLSGSRGMNVHVANHSKNTHIEGVYAGGWFDGGQRWALRDSVHCHPIDKEGWIDGPMGMTAIETPPETVTGMTEAMLRDWVGFMQGENSYQASLEDGVRVQRVLEQIREKL